MVHAEVGQVSADGAHRDGQGAPRWSCPGRPVQRDASSRVLVVAASPCDPATPFARCGAGWRDALHRSNPGDRRVLAALYETATTSFPYVQALYPPLPTS
jgi:hypothetical protein